MITAHRHHAASFWALGQSRTEQARMDVSSRRASQTVHRAGLSVGRLATSPPAATVEDPTHSTEREFACPMSLFAELVTPRRSQWTSPLDSHEWWKPLLGRGRSTPALISWIIPWSTFRTMRSSLIIRMQRLPLLRRAARFGTRRFIRARRSFEFSNDEIIPGGRLMHFYPCAQDGLLDRRAIHSKALRQHLACDDSRQRRRLLRGEGGGHAASCDWRERLHASHMDGDTAPLVAFSISICEGRAGSLFPRDQ